MNAYSSKRCKGQVVVLTALTMIVLIGAVGLAIDSGLGYIVRAKLNAALDAAAIAAARDVVLGDTQAQQADNAQKAATKFFNANYPSSGFFNSTRTLNPIGTLFEQGKVTIDVSATARSPVVLVRVLNALSPSPNFDLLSVASSAQVVRKDLDMSVVLDTTDSMVAVSGQVKAAAKDFLTHFSNTTDRVALIHFAHGAVVDEPFHSPARGFNRPLMNTLITNYTFTGFTNFADGFWHARNQLNSIPVDKRSTLRVIVFFSDGSPNTFGSFFAFKSAPTGCTYEGTGPYYVAGALQTAAASSGTPDGLWRFDAQSTQLPGGATGCYKGAAIVGCAAAANCLNTTGLPAFYNPHDRLNTGLDIDRFPVVTGAPRPVTNSTSTANTAYANVNRAARNLPEAMAVKARSEGIYVYTLGLGSHATDLTGPDNESGETLLKCMANTTDATCASRNPGQPVGAYCWAANIDDLAPCFAKLASAIMRITK
jgi:Flp pilus assembly protein TadG